MEGLNTYFIRQHGTRCVEAAVSHGGMIAEELTSSAREEVTYVLVVLGSRACSGDNGRDTPCLSHSSLSNRQGGIPYPEQQPKRVENGAPTESG